MRIHLGAGWRICHLTDRVIDLCKDDATYRQITGRDGFVRVRAEPGMDRAAMLEKAVAMAQRTDGELADIVLRQKLLPRMPRYRMELRRLANTVFGTGQEAEVIGVKHA